MGINPKGQGVMLVMFRQAVKAGLPSDDKAKVDGVPGLYMSYNDW